MALTALPEMRIVWPQHEGAHDLTTDEEADFTAFVQRQSRFVFRVAYAVLLNSHDAEDALVIPIGKPTVVFSSDALENKGGMQLLVTATLLH